MEMRKSENVVASDKSVYIRYAVKQITYTIERDKTYHVE